MRKKLKKFLFLNWEYYLYNLLDIVKKTKDYRFLNAALKINDLLIVNKNELKIKIIDSEN